MDKGEIIRSEREGRNLSRLTLARLSGVEAERIEAIEEGAGAKVSELEALVDALVGKAGNVKSRILRMLGLPAGDQRPPTLSAAQMAKMMPSQLEQELTRLGASARELAIADGNEDELLALKERLSPRTTPSDVLPV